jgi:hypothetical protein
VVLVLYGLRIKAVRMDLISSSNKSSHTYNEVASNEIFKKIVQDYCSEMSRFKDKMEEYQVPKLTLP